MNKMQSSSLNKVINSLLLVTVCKRCRWQYNSEIFAEKYVNVAKRFHYVEDKIRRKDAERLTAEKTILETLEKLNSGQEKIQKMAKSNEDSMKQMKDSRITEQETETKFKETLKRYFKVEAQLLKVRFKLRWIFRSMSFPISFPIRLSIHTF